MLEMALASDAFAADPPKGPPLAAFRAGEYGGGLVMQPWDFSPEFIDSLLRPAGPARAAVVVGQDVLDRLADAVREPAAGTVSSGTGRGPGWLPRGPRGAASRCGCDPNEAELFKTTRPNPTPAG